MIEIHPSTSTSSPETISPISMTNSSSSPFQKVKHDLQQQSFVTNFCFDNVEDDNYAHHNDDDDDDDNKEIDFAKFDSYNSHQSSNQFSSMVGIGYDDDDDDEEVGKEEDDKDDSLSEEEEASTSCASTVVNDKPPRLVRPPPTATKEEQAKFYWELCYGKDTKQQKVPQKQQSDSQRNMNNAGSWSASRKPPMKSCLSAKKTQWTEIAQSSSGQRSARRLQRIQLQQQQRAVLTDDKEECLEKRTPTVLDQLNFTAKSGMNPSPLERNQFSAGVNSVKNEDVLSFRNYTPNMKTPQSHNEESCSAIKSVKFGDSSAAEFESSRPTVELTPLPSDKVREQFPVDEKDELSEDESTEMHHETARNGERLAIWDEDFDDYLDEWGDNDADGELEDNSRHSLGELKTNKNKNSGSRRSDRRSSVFFSRGGGSLVQFDNKENQQGYLDENTLGQDANNIIAYSVVDENKISPSSSRDSMQFSSPSFSSSYRLSSSDSEISKITPKADVRSSSSLLRSVHSAGGAHMGRNNEHGVHDDTCQDLKPSQLDETLQKAEKNLSRHIMHEKPLRKRSFTDKIIEETIVEPTKY